MPDTTGPQQKQQTTLPLPQTYSLLEVERPSSTDPNELIESRFLCRCGGALLIGATGIGKSSLALQMAICWALGRECFGFRPRWKLKSLLIQAENDDGDMAESRDGIFDGLQLSGEEREQVGSMVRIRQETDLAGAEFWSHCIKPIVQVQRPDLVWVDHALAYLGADARLQAEVGGWLRRHCTPLMREYTFAPFILHHTNKPPPNGKATVTHERDYSYMASGTIEWPGWARAVITLKEVGDKIFELRAPKRGERLHWPQPCRFIRHSQVQDRIFWEESEPKQTPKEKEMGDRQDSLFNLLPAQGYTHKQWKAAANDAWGITKSIFDRDIRALAAVGRTALVNNLWVPIPTESKDVFSKYRQKS